jgi:ribosomal protein S18 acetylase RimI-like enzyme
MSVAFYLRHEPRRRDPDDVERILHGWGQFRPSEIAVARELVLDRLEKGQRSEYRFVFADRDGRMAGFACYGPIAVTVSSFDLYWIAVEAEAGSMGIGTALMEELLRLVSFGGGRKIFVETSSGSVYAPARLFYSRHGFEHICTVPDFYAPGDDKLIFGRSL